MSITYGPEHSDLRSIETELNKPKAYVFVDASNIHYYLMKKGWPVDWRKFKLFCESQYESPKFFYYEGVPSKSQYFDLHPDHSLADFIEVKKRRFNYLKFLKSISYKVRHKPVGRVYDDTAGAFRHKCNFDVELTVDALDELAEHDVFVLFSGDGDFVKLVKYLKGKKKKGIVIAASERLSNNLKRAANQVIYLEDIKWKISMQKKKALLLQGPFASVWHRSFSHLQSLYTLLLECQGKNGDVHDISVPLLRQRRPPSSRRPPS